MRCASIRWYYSNNSFTVGNLLVQHLASRCDVGLQVIYLLAGYLRCKLAEVNIRCLWELWSNEFIAWCAFDVLGLLIRIYEYKATVSKWHKVSSSIFLERSAGKMERGMSSRCARDAQQFPFFGKSPKWTGQNDHLSLHKIISAWALQLRHNIAITKSDHESLAKLIIVVLSEIHRRDMPESFEHDDMLDMEKVVIWRNLLAKWSGRFHIS